MSGPCLRLPRNSRGEILHFENLRDWKKLELKTMASNVWHTFMSLRLSGFKPYLEAGAGWFAQVKETLKVLVKVRDNPFTTKGKTTSPQVRHKIKMASLHLSMDEVSQTYKITSIRRS